MGLRRFAALRRRRRRATMTALPHNLMEIKMRVLVCGGRHFSNRAALFEALDRYADSHGIDHIIEGGARGADRLAREWATYNKVPYTTFEADWKNHHKSAGAIRNGRMLRDGKPDVVIAFPGGPGTRNMRDTARHAKVPVIEVDCDHRVRHHKEEVS